MLSAILTKLQSELNQLIPEQIDLGPLSHYQGESFEFVVVDQMTVVLTIQDARIDLSLTPVEKPLVRVKASWSVWLQWLSDLKQKPPQAVEVVGQAEALETLQRWMKQYIELETILAHYIGDIPSNILVKIAQNTRHWLQARLLACQSNIHVYMTDNLQAWPYGHEGRELYREIDSLRLDVDRLSARIKQREQWV